ncbi:MoaD/ThiS family protein [Lacticaseibacillus baoqingensis]|uniref:MoaD/ThiS family protein n=1 Tax=Lacticaseibacillus baoqingensis TaxID=2486013 RepID=A0ABW4EBU8_9LACO|nr:MoaD/ThiS family protein [Lacticaseibacillus baoqingensis]
MNIQLFSLLAEALGAQVTIAVTTPTTADAIKTALAAAYPKYAALIAQSVVAVDQDYATADQQIDAAAEVALIPPVSGG